MKEELVIAYQSFFDTDSGKLILADLEKVCRYRKNAFNPKSDRITSYNLGCAWVVQYIHSVLERNRFEESKNEVVNEGINL